MKNYDVVIIGGGPAGATVGQYLKEQGISYLVIERGTNYRDKVCAGGVPVGIMDVLPVSKRNFERVEYDTLLIDFRATLKSTVKIDRPFMYGVARTEFDHFLREGLNVHYNEKFVMFEREKNGVVVHTDKAVYRAKFLVGADGVGSRVSIFSGLAKKRRFILAEEKETPLEDKDKVNNVKIFLGYNRFGYGWVFPKKDHRSSGSGALQKYFLHSKGTVNKFDRSKRQTKIYPISLWGGEEILTDGRIGLAGEAGNLVDPFTAGGIYPAVLSGKLLAQSIEKALKKGKSNLYEYNELLMDKMYEEFRYALFLSKMFYPFIPLIKKVILSRSVMQQAMEYASNGYISYKKFFEKVRKTRKIHIKIAYFLVKMFANK